METLWPDLDQFDADLDYQIPHDVDPDQPSKSESGSKRRRNPTTDPLCIHCRPDEKTYNSAHAPDFIIFMYDK